MWSSATVALDIATASCLMTTLACHALARTAEHRARRNGRAAAMVTRPDATLETEGIEETLSRLEAGEAVLRKWAPVFLIRAITSILTAVLLGMALISMTIDMIRWIVRANG